MSQSSGSKESTFFLWTIVPVAAMLTLLFVSVNHHTVPNKEVLDGSHPATVQTADQHAITEIHAPDTTAAEAPVADQAADHAAE